MNFASVGDRVYHRKHGQGVVTRLIGQNEDDGIVIRLSNGKSIKVDYSQPDSGWRLYTRGDRKAASYKPASRREGVEKTANRVLRVLIGG